MLYRRADQAGATYFFTVNLNDRSKAILVTEIDKLRVAINQVKQRHPFKLDAMVVLPEHLHALITLPEGDSDFANRWMLIKAGFSRQIPNTEFINNSRASKKERGIWQRRYWEHLIRDDEDYRHHVNYIHINPVKHGHVNRAVDWPYSTIHHYIAQGLLQPDWGCSVDEFSTLDFGEGK